MAERSHIPKHPESPEDEGLDDDPRQRRLENFIRARDKHLVPESSTSNSVSSRSETQSPSRSQSVIARVRSVASAARQRLPTESPPNKQVTPQPPDLPEASNQESEAVLRRRLVELERQLAAVKSQIPEERTDQRAQVRQEVRKPTRSPQRN